MVSVKEVSADKVISELKEMLKSTPEIQMPEWAKFVKTGAHAERKPQDKDWWYTRAASILRKIYIAPGVGVERLRTWYGGRKNRGRKPEKHVKASGKIIRLIIQQLEKAELVKKQKAGRIVTGKARSMLDKITNKVKGEKFGGPRIRRVKTEETAEAPAAKRGRTAKRTAPKKTAKPGSARKINKVKPGEPPASGESV